MAEDIRHRGPITEYRPEKDDVSGGRDKSVQSEAVGAEGSSNLAQSGTTSGGAAGRIEDDARKPSRTR